MERWAAIAELLKERVFSYLRVSKEIHIDELAQFESRFRKEKKPHHPLSPQANEVVERRNRTLYA